MPALEELPVQPTDIHARTGTQGPQACRHPQIHTLTQPHTATLPYLSRGAQTPGPAPSGSLPDPKRVREPLLEVLANNPVTLELDARTKHTT